MEYINKQFLLDKRPLGMPEDDCWKLNEEKITSLKKCPPAIILTRPNNNPKINPTLFFNFFQFYKTKKFTLYLVN